MKFEISGLILCGGKSSRLGQNKALLTINGKTLLQWTIEKFKRITKEILIAPRGSLKQDFQDCIIIDDFEGFSGPFAAVLAGIEKATFDKILALACDFPLVSEKFLLHIIECANNNDKLIFVPYFQNFYQPLVGLYKKAILPFMYEWLKNDKTFSLQKFIKSHENFVMPITENYNFSYTRELFNLNTPDDLENLYKLVKVK
jgi:molybdopterin-guanine dinucleotide biosynthesis protein A